MRRLTSLFAAAAVLGGAGIATAAAAAPPAPVSILAVSAEKWP